jgi:lysophospholipase L1-like esterase
MLLMLLACTGPETETEVETESESETDVETETETDEETDEPVETGGEVDLCTTLPESSSYEGTVSRWTEQDVLDPLDDEGWVVFTGSSSIRRWERAQQDFADWGVIQRGFGGARLDEVALFADALISAHDPAGIVVFAGTNDVAAGEDSDTVFQDFRCLVQRAPDVPIVYIGITPTPSRWSSWETSNAVNERVEAFAAVHPRVFYADVAEAFLQTGSPPASELFVEDQLHLSAAGYALWTAVIKPVLKQALPPARSPATGGPEHGRVLVDLGPSNTDDGAQTGVVDGLTWNSWHALEGGAAVLAGEHLALVTTDGEPSGARLTISGQFSNNGYQNGGLQAPDPALLGDLAVSTATGDYFFTQGSDAPGAVVLTGLKPSTEVTLRLFASREWGSETRVTGYVVSGSTRHEGSITVSGKGVGADGYDGNTSEVAEFVLLPDEHGQIVVDVQILQGSYGYLGLLDLSW